MTAPTQFAIVEGRLDPQELAALLVVLLAPSARDRDPRRISSRHAGVAVRRRLTPAPPFPTPRSWKVGDPVGRTLAVSHR